MSKSHGALAALPRAVTVTKPTQPTPSHFIQNTRVASTYVKKANVMTQTETGKYSYMDATDGAYTAHGKEWTLKRELEDAELVI